MKHPNIVIAGAGSIGCFVGGHLAKAGHRVTLLARPHVIADITANGLTITDLSGASDHIAAAQLTLTDSPDCLRDADLVLVTVKSGATGEMTGLISAYAKPGAPVLSLQNGLFGIETLTADLPGRDVRAGMVAFNVVPNGRGIYHRATSGQIMMASGPGGLAATLSSDGLPVTEVADITAIQYGKLLLNLNNALNALSGQPLLTMLLDPRWRGIMADQMAEALRVFRAAKVTVASTTPLPASFTPHVLRLPTPLFRRIATKMLSFDPSARSSMSYDLMAGRRTEIDMLQGAVIAMGARHDVPTPLNARLHHLIREAETTRAGLPNLSPAEVLGR